MSDAEAALAADLEAVLSQFPWRDFGVLPAALTRAIPEVAADLAALVVARHLPRQ